jgi:Spindle and kinetochore-associated protein 1
MCTGTRTGGGSPAAEPASAAHQCQFAAAPTRSAEWSWSRQLLSGGGCEICWHQGREPWCRRGRRCSWQRCVCVYSVTACCTLRHALCQSKATVSRTVVLLTLRDLAHKDRSALCCTGGAAGKGQDRGARSSSRGATGGGAPGGAGTTAAGAAPASAPRWYVTSAELASVPSYMRGRLTLDKVCISPALPCLPCTIQCHAVWHCTCMHFWRRCSTSVCYEMCVYEGFRVWGWGWSDGYNVPTSAHHPMLVPVSVSIVTQGQQ